MGGTQEFGPSHNFSTSHDKVNSACIILYNFLSTSNCILKIDKSSHHIIIVQQAQFIYEKFFHTLDNLEISW